MQLVQIRALLGAVLSLFIAVSAQAQDITLSSPDGKVEISGKFLGYDGEFYRVDTIFGELTVDGSGVNCAGPACPSLTQFIAEVRIVGSQSIGNVLMPALLEGFAIQFGYEFRREAQSPQKFNYVLLDADDNPRARFFFDMSTSDQGFDALINEEADIILSTRELTEFESELARSKGLGDLTERNASAVLALDALIPISAPSNSFSHISPAKLLAAFRGEITSWQDLDGSDAPLNLHLPSAKLGVGQAAAQLIAGEEGAPLASTVTRHESMDALVAAVLRDPFALGIVNYSQLGDAQPLTLSGPCGYALSATRRSIKTEDYPLTAPLFLYRPSRRLPKIARDFLSFTRSPVAQNVIRRSGYIDQAPEEINIDTQGYRFANAITAAGVETDLEELQRMARTLYGQARLTTSFRFEAGSARLDAQSRSNVEQLARALEQGRYDGRTLTFVGFSDGDGPADTNRRIAMQRAEAVRAAVTSASPTANFARVTISTEAFGEALPMGCDNSEWGRRTNRRVEVWVE